MVSEFESVDGFADSLLVGGTFRAVEWFFTSSDKSSWLSSSDPKILYFEKSVMTSFFS